MIYIVEDDDNIRELVLYTLNNYGLQAAGFERPSAFWDALQQQRPALVILDIMLPEEDGLHMLKALRANAETARLPIMLLTAKGAEYDKVKGLDSGADDYMTKPFGMMELTSRVKALLRRSEQQPDQYRLGALCVCPDRHQVTVNGQAVLLTVKEFELLCQLLRHPGRVFGRDQLLQQVWGYTFEGESRTVDVHVRTLRQKLGPCGAYIETVRGVGYKLEGPPA